MYNVGKKILLTMAFWVALVASNSVQAASVLDQPLHQQVIYHRELGELTLAVRPGEPTLQSCMITIKKGQCVVGHVVFKPAHMVSDQELQAFRAATGRTTLAGYAYVYALKIERACRNKKLCSLLLWALEKELKKQKYTGVCFIADPYNVGSNIFEPDTAVYEQQLKSLLGLYEKFGLMPQKDVSGDLVRVQSPWNKRQQAVVCVQPVLREIPLPAQISLTPFAAPVVTPASNVRSSRLTNFLVTYRRPLLLALGSALVCAGIKYSRMSNARAVRVAVGR